MRSYRVPAIGKLIAASLAAAALFAVVSLPHRHESAATHRTESCRACKIQEGFSAQAPAAVQPLLAQLLVAFASVLLIQVPRLEPVYSQSQPRAPPQLS